MAKNPEDDWLDYDRAAKYLHDRIPGGFTRRSLEKAKYDGKINNRMIRGKAWFHKDELDRYVNVLLGVYK